MTDAEFVEAAIRNRELVQVPGGSKNAAPLVYVCFDEIGSSAGGVFETARILLSHGADPNASYLSTDYPDSPFACLYGASGLRNNVELTRLLLEAGADPNDGESVYHSTEHADQACLKLLLDHGGKATQAIYHQLDREDPAGLGLLISAGIDPLDRHCGGDTPLHWAVFRGRSIKCVALLLEAGVPIDAARKDGRTAYAVARLTQQTAVAELLEARGAATALSPIDAIFARPTLPNPLPPIADWNDIGWLLSDLVSRRQTDRVKNLVFAGFPLDSRGDHGATALHWACWMGYPDVVRFLIEQGAPLTVRDLKYDGTPAEWCEHGAKSRGMWGDHAEVRRLLRAAGA